MTTSLHNPRYLAKLLIFSSVFLFIYLMITTELLPILTSIKPWNISHFNINAPALSSQSLLIYDRIYIDKGLHIVKGNALRGPGNEKSLWISVRKGNGEIVEGGAVEWKKQTDSCPWSYAKKCRWCFFAFEATLPTEKVNSELDALILTTKDFEAEIGNIETIPAILPNHTYTYNIAICVPPLYFAADWLQLIHFIEIWMNLGAEKIWIYVNSMTERFDLVLRAYEQEGVVERILWPALPSTSQFDANKGWWRVGDYSARNDCLFRTTGLVKFLTILDLDDFIVPPLDYGLRLLDYLKHYDEKHPKFGSVIYRHNRVGFSPYTDFSRPITLRNYTFSELRNNLYYKHEAFANGKFFTRPERARIASVHAIIKHAPGYVQRHDKKVSYIHLRKADLAKRRAAIRKFKLSDEKYSRFEGIIGNMTSRFQAFVADFLPDVDWLKTDTEVLFRVALCRIKWPKMKGCQSTYEICPDVMTQTPVNWIRYLPSNSTHSWIPL